MKIAFCAGHYRNTPGKRLPAQLDENQTREWVLNDRVARAFAQAAEDYEDVSLLRTDDPTGQTEISIPQRTAAANRWGADLYLDFHHNAAGRVFDGGGVEVYAYPGSQEGIRFRDAIYQAVIAAGGLTGDRSQPLREKAFDSLSLTEMPAVLVEYGFMDSTVDAPIILEEAYAKKVGTATMDAIAALQQLRKKPVAASVYGYPLAQFIRDVQTACGAQVDGIAGPETLGKTVTLSQTKNRTHPAVRAVQKRLMSLGYRDVGPVDGIAGPKFTGGVIDFQEDHRCWVDGEVSAGQKTWRKLLGME